MRELHLLKEKKASLDERFSLWELRTELPCCRFLEAGGQCGKETRWALVYLSAIAKGDATLSVYPYCKKHLPPSARDALRRGEDDG